MKRWAVNLFCLFSLLVFVSSVTIWVRSYFALEQISRTSQLSPSTMVNCGGFWTCGTLSLSVERMWGYPIGAAQLGWHNFQSRPIPFVYLGRSPADKTYLQIDEFLFEHREQGTSIWSLSEWCVVVPLWLFFPTAVPPFLWWRKWRRGRGGLGFPVNQTMNDERGRMKVEEDQRIV